MSDIRHFDVGVDIGGTFTDFVIRNRSSGALRLHKALTTPDDPSRSVIEGVRHLLGEENIVGANINVVVHGTTLITNALIERRGATTALITTEGHRDVLEIGTELRYDSYDLGMDKPDPLVPRPLRFGVRERLDHQGNVLTTLDEGDLSRISAELQEANVASVAVCYLHSFRNNVHEQRTREIIESNLPHVSVSLSSDVAPEIREYQRASTTVANAYVKPLSGRYLKRLEEALQSLGYASELFLMLSSGGISRAEVAAQYPIQLLESGPAGGVLFASFLGKLTNREELVSFDMGGTTAKMAFVAAGTPMLARSFEVARVSRFRLGSGLPVQIPVIEMIEIGAGGGSIAHKDSLGLLKVGPRSAGASPGPASYGFGGEEPTVTDANVVLGYLAPRSFLGGEMRLDVEAARRAIERGIAEPLQMDTISAARGIFDVVNENMVSATKVHMAEKARDPRRASLVAFGGAGPVHAHAIANALDMREVICPLRAGVASALGFLTAPIAFDFARSMTSSFSDLDTDELNTVFSEMENRGATLLSDAGIAPSDVRHERSADMHYIGQGHDVEVPLPSGDFTPENLSDVAERFHASYAKLYGQAHPNVAIEFVTCRVTSSGPDSDLRLPELEAGQKQPSSEALLGTRQVYFAPDGFVDTRIVNRYALRTGNVLVGPAVVEERESTVVIPPSMAGHVDAFGNLVLTRKVDGGPT